MMNIRDLVVELANSSFWEKNQRKEVDEERHRENISAKNDQIMKTKCCLYKLGLSLSAAVWCAVATN